MQTLTTGDRVRIARYKRLGSPQKLEGRQGQIVSTHFAGFYVLIDKTNREQEPQKVLFCTNPECNGSDILEKI